MKQNIVDMSAHQQMNTLNVWRNKLSGNVIFADAEKQR
jgi:hypothetical protein